MSADPRLPSNQEIVEGLFEEPKGNDENQTFSIYISGILKLLYPNLDISNPAQLAINSFIIDSLQLIAQKASDLRATNDSIIGIGEIQNAVRQTLSGELAAHAVAEGTKAIAKLNSYLEKPVSTRAGLQLPVGHIYHYLREGNYAVKYHAGAPVFLTAVLDYLVVEIFEIAGQVALSKNQGCIIPRTIMIAFNNDAELKKILSSKTQELLKQ